MTEIKTLQELNLKPGDVVECVTTIMDGNWTVGKTYLMGEEGLQCDISRPQKSSLSAFRIISRASDTTKLWRDMTDAEKGALLLAHHEGKVIEGRDETWTDEDWLTISHPAWHNNYAYRIRPEPKRLTVPLMADFKEIGTIDLVDGKPDQSSIKMGDAEGGEA